MDKVELYNNLKALLKPYKFDGTQCQLECSNCALQVHVFNDCMDISYNLCDTLEIIQKVIKDEEEFI